ncbi:MAG: potassium transporter Kup [Alphaproteobacteria bacterium]|nr:potassium transporter Kup [Alphaproteobacteria bacterium]MBV9371265.1 potassium transporter Kup [Alphaproteobacteria bacterium]MBV9902796.1 potassium transporter Kup [Alphaproteobacteria bacterium]
MADIAAPSPPAEGTGAPRLRPGFTALTLGAVGVVFGDIGTSPLYALREAFAGHHGLAIAPATVLGILSLIFWSMMLVVTLKYITVLTRADNKGEGGSLALLALISRSAGGAGRTRSIVLLGVFACALFYGDSMITPAISVLAAVEGLAIVHPSLEPAVVPIAVLLLGFLFLGRRAGAPRLSAAFGPILLVYFLTLAVLGGMAVARHPSILAALDPAYAWAFVAADPLRAFLALGSVVLAVTGAEALYAEMGQFGRRPIAAGWAFGVLPALALNYFGQGALLLENPATIASPFYSLAPAGFALPLVVITTLAALIATQAVISGAFSVTHQAIQLGFVPRLRILYTGARQATIYIPVVNWVLMVAVIALVASFRSSSDLASAYGIAVTGAMLIDTCLLGVLLLTLWKWKRWLTLPLLGLFLIVDAAFFAATLTKFPDGGWFPLLVGIVVFTLLTTWSRGRQLMRARMRDSAMPVEIFIRSAANSATRVAGTAVFMTASPEGVPPSLLHNLKHNRCLHERVMLLTVETEDVPHVEEERRCELHDLGSGFYRLILRFGFMDDSDIPEALRTVRCGPNVRMMETSFFLARQTLIASPKPGMAIWREKLFAWMLRNAESAMEFFRLPPNRVVELGSQVEI